LARRLRIAVLGLAGMGLVLTLASLDSAAQTGAPFPRQRTGPQVVTLTAVPGPGQISTTG
jgi:hypothetical protein